MYYRIKYFLVPTFRLDFKNVFRYKIEEWLCPDCVTRVQRDRQNKLNSCELKLLCEQDSHEHARLFCPSNSQLREKTNFNDPKQEVVFFRKIIERRNEQGIQ